MPACLHGILQGRQGILASSVTLASSNQSLNLSVHNQLSDSNQQALRSSSTIDKPEMTEMSSFSDASVTARRACLPRCDKEEVILAASEPKRRAGRRALEETRHPVYRCVRWRKKKWVCEVRVPNKRTRIWLGTYPTAEMAARAHDVAALALRGKKACLNFADSAWRLRVPDSEDQLDIRRAAAEAAETFRPSEFGGVSSSCDDDNNDEKNNDNDNNKIENEKLALGMDNKNEGFYEDEEAMYNMPGLLTSMAEGLLITPPLHYLDNMNWGVDDPETEPNFSMWS
ncbi:dehydration-responsive element-binding protein 1B-like [Argentina anserina]|uniref:dehydration-responsive element-binding protein 1B-like n=1 Tax=Argentina anserina TaxID=57926 RepID=UPI0021762EB3|nr:dehydration-responsive element-binding protein 1B-like [Potentilla anserina]